MLEMPHSVQWLTPTPQSSAISNSAGTVRKLLSALVFLIPLILLLIVVLIITGLKMQYAVNPLHVLL